MCSLRKRKLFPPRAYFVWNLIVAGELLSTQNDWNRGKWSGEATEQVCREEQANAQDKVGFFIQKHGYCGEGKVVSMLLSLLLAIKKRI